MKSVKAIVLITGFLLVGSLAKARSLEGFLEKDPVKRAQFRTNILKEKLALTPAQYTKVLALNIRTAHEMQPLLFGNYEPYDMAVKAMPIAKKQQKELRLILTKEQGEKMDDLRKEMRPKIRQLIQEWLKQD